MSICWCVLQDNKTLEKITINSELSLVEFRDEKTQELNLSFKGYREEEAIIIAALLRVCFIARVSATGRLQILTTTHNHPQPPTTTHNNPITTTQAPTTTPQLPKSPPLLSYL